MRLTGEDLRTRSRTCATFRVAGDRAAQLVGGDGVAIITPATTVFDAMGLQLTRDAATTAVEADTVVLKASSSAAAGGAVADRATFSASRADISD